MKAVYASLVGLLIGIFGMLIFGRSDAGLVCGVVFIASMLTLWIVSIVEWVRRSLNYTPD